MPSRWCCLWHVASPMPMQVLLTLTYDLEIDSADPDAVGSLYPNCLDDLGQPVF